MVPREWIRLALVEPWDTHGRLWFHNVHRQESMYRPPIASLDTKEGERAACATDETKKELSDVGANHIKVTLQSRETDRMPHSRALDIIHSHGYACIVVYRSTSTPRILLLYSRSCARKAHNVIFHDVDLYW